MVGYVVVDLTSIFLYRMGSFSFRRVRGRSFSSFAIPASTSLRYTGSCFPASSFRYGIPQETGLAGSLEAGSEVRERGAAGLLEVKFTVVGYSGSVDRCLALLFLGFELGFLSKVCRGRHRLVALEGLVV